MNVVIIIPVYKKKMSSNEEISFTQCMNILSNYEICLIAHGELDLSEYIDIISSKSIRYSIQIFEKKYFNNINSYNNLLLQKFFYESFIGYDYMLLYQLDAFVFRDELLYWCSQNYDYIGAPWFENHGSIEEGNSLCGGVGNGGFSLRRINFFIRAYSWKYPILKPLVIIKNYYKFHSLYHFIIRLPYIILKCLGFQNNIGYYTRNNKYVETEDVFWSLYTQKSWIKTNIPDEKTAMKFSFEKSPAYLYKLNNNELPFGCHAWEKYDLNFWRTHINKYGFSI